MGAIDYTFQIRDLYSEDIKHDNFEAYTGGYVGTFLTYEEAESACLDKLIEIANRVKGKGDTWEVTGVETPQNSLTDALEAWFEIATIKPKAFRLDLVQGKLYSIFPEEVQIEEPKPKKYNIYGDYE